MQSGESPLPLALLLAPLPQLVARIVARPVGRVHRAPLLLGEVRIVVAHLVPRGVLPHRVRDHVAGRVRLVRARLLKALRRHRAGAVAEPCLVQRASRSRCFTAGG